VTIRDVINVTKTYFGENVERMEFNEVRPRLTIRHIINKYWLQVYLALKHSIVVKEQDVLRIIRFDADSIDLPYIFLLNFARYIAVLMILPTFFNLS